MRTMSTRCARPCGAGMDRRTKFLLIRVDGLGDALACVPSLAGLARAHPDAAFGAVCSPANAQLYSSLVQTHVYAGGPPGDLARELRAARYTHALVATEEVIGYRLARAAGVPRRAGFWHRFEKTFKSLWQYAQLTDRVYRPAAWIARPEHEVEALYRLAAIYGAPAPPPADAAELRPWLAIDRSAAGSHRAQARGEPLLGVQAARKLANGGWGPAALAHFIAAALERSSLRRCLLVASAADEGFARSILEQIPRALREGGQVALGEPTDVPRWLGLIESLAVLITPDTGAAHAAGMLGVPIIDLFDEDRFAQLERQWRPWAARHRCVIKPAWQTGRDASFGAQVGAAVKDLLA
jgi:ADP-heptose:LPS heptosyltransferase